MKPLIKVKPDAYGYLPEKYKLWNTIDLFLGDLVVDDNGIQFKNYYHITNRNGKKFFMLGGDYIEFV